MGTGGGELKIPSLRDVIYGQPLNNFGFFQANGEDDIDQKTVEETLRASART